MSDRPTDSLSLFMTFQFIIIKLAQPGVVCRAGRSQPSPRLWRAGRINEDWCQLIDMFRTSKVAIGVALQHIQTVFREFNITLG